MICRPSDELGLTALAVSKPEQATAAGFSKLLIILGNECMWIVEYGMDECCKFIGLLHRSYQRAKRISVNINEKEYLPAWCGTYFSR